MRRAVVARLRGQHEQDIGTKGQGPHVYVQVLAEAKLIPPQSNWASTMRDPLRARLVYQRLEWDKAQPPAPKLQGIFETGRRIEKLVLKQQF